VGYLTRKRIQQREETGIQNKIADQHLFAKDARSKVYEMVREERKEKKVQNVVQKEEKIQMLNRRYNYSRYVKETHLPAKSDKKASELQVLIA